MEMCNGGEILDYVMDQGNLEENVVKKIMLQLFKAVKYIHSEGICHRDLKPENFLLSEKNNLDSDIKIVDFGLS